MTLTTSIGGGPAFTRATRVRHKRGYAARRQRYDARRRRVPLNADGRAYAAIVRGDPCSYCMGFCGQMAADHITGLDDGGRNEWQNLTAAGRPCNGAKRERDVLEFLLGRRA